MVVTDLNFQKLNETESLIVGFVFEDAYLIDKISSTEIHLGSFYSNPSCALIDLNNEWCLVGGAELSLWKADGSIIRIEEDDLYWACKIRQTTRFEVEILVDAWSDNTSVWGFNTQSLERRKLYSLPKLNDQYSEDIDW